MERARPPIADWAAPAGGNSFPSGHTTAATIGAGLLAWAVCRHLPNPAGRAAVWGLAVLYAATVGWSRVWLGVHWPLDVAGGWLFGTGWLAAAGTVIAAAGRGSARLLDTTPVPPDQN
jgi:undecaprenyl-diphosphatase